MEEAANEVDGSLLAIVMPLAFTLRCAVEAKSKSSVNQFYVTKILVYGLFFYLKGREKERERERERNGSHPLVLFSECLQQAGLGEGNAGNWELCPDLPRGWQGFNDLTHPCCCSWWTLPGICM